MLARAPGGQRGLALSVRALGSQAHVRWLLDGRLFGETLAGNSWVTIPAIPANTR